MGWVDTQVAPFGYEVNRYRFELDPIVLRNVPDIIADMLARNVIQGRNGQPVALSQAVTAYESATAGAVTNILTQSQVTRRNAEQTLMSMAYRNRVGNLAARMFEEMQGFTDQTRTDLARALADGVARGESPAVIAKTIRDRLDVAESRALRIARTEINNAHRRAIIDEDVQTNEEGVFTRLMHLSALSPTTRYTHAVRHGHIYHRDQVEDFYSRDGNAINCKCSLVSVLVDASGQPLYPGLPTRLRANGRKFVERQDYD